MKKPPKDLFPDTPEDWWRDFKGPWYWYLICIIGAIIVIVVAIANSG